MNIQATPQGQEGNPQDQVPTDPGVTDPQGSVAVVAPVETIVPAPVVRTEAPSNGTSKQGDTKVVELKQSAFKRIKQQAQQRGFKKAEQDILARFAKHGCSSLDDVEKMLESRSTPAKPVEETPMATKNPGKNGKDSSRQRSNGRPNAADRRLVKSEQDKDVATRKWRAERNRRKVSERRNDALQAQMELQRVAMLAGVTDVDYALRLAWREMDGKSMEELAKFDESAFFEGLRKSKPYIFGEIEVPATTGTAGNGSSEVPEPPSSDEVTTQGANGQQFDAKNATQEEVDAQLRQLGISPM